MAGAQLSAAPTIAAADSVEATMRSDATGGDGIAGLVIGIVDVRDSDIDASNKSENASGVGGDAESKTFVRIALDGQHFRFAREDRSADAVSGDGIMTTVAGARHTRVAPLTNPPTIGQVVGHVLLP